MGISKGNSWIPSDWNSFFYKVFCIYDSTVYKSEKGLGFRGRTEGLFDEERLRACVFGHFRDVDRVKFAMFKVVLGGK